MGRTNDITLYRHAQDAAFLWRRRVSILRSTAKHSQRVALDQRLDNHLYTLAAAGEAGQRAASEARHDSRHPGHLLAAAYLALTLNRHAEFARALETQGQPDATTFAELVTAIGWSAAHQVAPALECWSRSADPWLTRLGIAGLAAHRLPAGPALAKALRSPDPALRATGANVVGKVGTVDALGALRELLADDNAEVALQAARSTARFADDVALKDRLVAFAEGDDPTAAQQAVEALAPIAPAAAVALFRRWAANPRTRRIAIVLAEALGAPELVPSLIVWMNDDDLARRAGDAFSAITGIHLADNDLTREAPTLNPSNRSDNGSDPRLALGSDHGLPFPAPLRVAAWWREHEREFDPARRYAWGGLGAGDGCLRVFLGLARTAPPRCQTRAARALARMHPEKPCLETHAAATWAHPLPGMNAWAGIGAGAPALPRAAALRSG